MIRPIYSFLLFAMSIVGCYGISKAAGTALPLKNAYQIKVELRPFQNQYIYLARYAGEYVIHMDSALLDQNSIAEFTGTKKLPGGLYVIDFPDRSGSMDFLIDNNQRFSIHVHVNPIAPVIKFKRSSENTKFQTYQEFMRLKGMEIDYTVHQLHETRNSKDSMRWIQRLKALDSLIYQERETIVKQNPNTLFSAILIAARSVTLPDALKNPKNAKDSLQRKQYILNHYWDGVNFTDTRLLNTPFFDSKMEYYFTEILKEKSDTVIQKLDKILGAASKSEEMTQVLVSKLIKGCMSHAYKWDDPVFVHVFKHYIEKKTYAWLDAHDRKTISERAYFLMGNGIGTPAADMILPDLDGVKKSLYSLDAKYTVVGFWDPTCSHCKESLPRLDSMYQAKWKAAGLKVFLVSMESEGNRQDWSDYIHQSKLQDWTNVYCSNQDESVRVAMGLTRYLHLYDVWYSPTFYILDKEKRFLAKKLTFHTMMETLESLIK